MYGQVTPSAVLHAHCHTNRAIATVLLDACEIAKYEQAIVPRGSGATCTPLGVATKPLIRDPLHENGGMWTICSESTLLVATKSAVSDHILRWEALLTADYPVPVMSTMKLIDWLVEQEILGHLEDKLKNDDCYPPYYS